MTLVEQRVPLRDLGGPMKASEILRGLEKLSSAWSPTLPYTPEQNAKAESFWSQVEGRLLPMLDDAEELTLERLAMKLALLASATLVAAAVAACSSEPPGPEDARVEPVPDAPGAARPLADAGGMTDGSPDAAGRADYPFSLPNGFPRPQVPPNNPLTKEKVALGRHLFYDELSGNCTQSCGSCWRLACTDDWCGI